MAKPGWLADALKRHAERFPPLPPRTAHLTYVVDDRVVEVTFKVSEAKWLMLRDLFPGKTDSEIVNEMADAVFAQVGKEVR
jgi:hypothetical protein